MFYAFQICGNKAHKRYGRIVDFITDDEDNPVETETEEEMIELLKDNPLFIAGWIQIAEIE